MEEKKISSDLIRGHIDTIILYSLVETDRFAQQISDFISVKSEKQYQINQATLYSSLDRLEKKKFVESYWHDSADGRRKFYRITTIGKDFVDDNLSNWSYSRVILDKLMGYSYTPQIFVTHNNIQNPNVNTSDIAKSNFTEKKEDIEKNIEEKNIINTSSVMQNSAIIDGKDINFRSILTGLIKNSEKSLRQEVKKEEMLDLTDKNKEEVIEEKEVAKFNEVITTPIDESSQSDIIEVDFRDIVSVNALEGYKIRFSSKDSVKSVGNLYNNKLRFFSMICLLLVACVEFLLLKLICNFSIFTNISSLVSICIITLFFLTSLFIFMFNGTKTVFKTATYDNILTSCIVVFNLLLVVFAVNFIFNIDLTNSFNLISYLVIPILMSLNIVVYYIIEYVLLKSKKFIVKSK